jgi:hypothetical protein
MIAQLRGAEELIESYSRIKSPRLRRALLQMSRSLANEELGLKEVVEA